MKKIMNKILATTADAALEAVIISAGLPSMGGIYQPEEPKNLKEIVKRCKGSKKMGIYPFDDITYHQTKS